MATNQTVIENPVINSPFVEPKRHFRFSDEGIANEIVEGRRVSSYFIPIPAVNNHAAYGRWAFVEITDPWDAKNTIRSAINVKGD